MPKFDLFKEERIIKAVEWLYKQEYPNIAKAGVDFDIDYCRLYRRYHGTPSNASKGGHNGRLNDVQDATLVKWVL